jgi:arylsulfatase
VNRGFPAPEGHLTIDELQFNGRVRWVEIDLAEDADHLITPDERLKIAMARQ